MYQLSNFSDRQQLEVILAEKVAELLSAAIAEKGDASIAVSGGSTPKGFFQHLSKQPLDWAKVTITLADERWVDASSDASNTALVKANLLQNEAVKAQFFELKRAGELTAETLDNLNREAQSILPFDVLMLGMGEDGHTASLFPCSDEIELGLTTAEPLLAVTPKTAPHQRISFSFKALIKSQHIFLQLNGASKQQVLRQAIESNDVAKMPIRGFLHDTEKTVQVYWAD